MVVQGYVAPGFGAVREELERQVAAGAETGAALTVLRRGEVLVELRAGWADRARTRPWAPDTLVNTYSVGKPVAALAALLLVDRGLIGLDDPVARHWPGFRATAVTVRHVLSHTAGLPAFGVPRDHTAWADWDLLCADLAAAEPETPPGSAAAEHALTYGHLVGELVRRVDGRPFGRFVAEEIAGPWGLDLGFALPAADLGRCAELEYAESTWPVDVLGEPGSLRHRALANPAGAVDLDVVNSPLWRRACVPAVGLHATATGLARLYDRLLAAPGAITIPQFTGVDLLLGRTVTWTLGMQLEPDGDWGMGGIGGSCGYAVPARGLAVGYVTRRLSAADRLEPLLEALMS
ncbi:serine hydrolase domain-containing protein [Spirilliplanes yamanashiensis]|uniref:EstA family serine hydrolase n=1 Tax=Spirilliplanes yamanashiensis TaxID=42233 RepID=A0A8J3Y7Q3_9ACTN|nr:serine hydrolase domain-containing protein [Spirilliplanes yamanashiensis]MDP9815187.1 CubicO group peptidase (beta-lactamase class C family) [Spirilliplanes yamanashiensis]GIJ02813.1 EstA family serine hydrolase [Spirilliplanes yamanashiensis]